jgi:hypothetical protein
MMLKAEAKASECVAEAVEYNKERWDKSHKAPDVKVGDLFLVSTTNFNNLGGSCKLKDAFVGPFEVVKLHGPNAVKVRLTEGFEQKHPKFPISLIKKYKSSNRHHKPEEVALPPFENKNKELVPTKIIDKKLTRVAGTDCQLYLTRFKNQSIEEDKWLQKEEIKNLEILLRKFQATKRGRNGTGIQAVLLGEQMSALSP